MPPIQPNQWTLSWQDRAARPATRPRQLRARRQRPRRDHGPPRPSRAGLSYVVRLEAERDELRRQLDEALAEPDAVPPDVARKAHEHDVLRAALEPFIAEATP